MPGTLDFKENIDVDERERGLDTQSSAVIRVIARSRERFLGETKGESIDDRARSIPRCVYSRRSHRSRENQFRFGRGRRGERNAWETVVETRETRRAVARSEGARRRRGWQKVIVPGSFRDSRDAILYILYQLWDSTIRDTIVRCDAYSAR